MHVVVMPPFRSASPAAPLRKLPDAENQAVQALVTAEVARRERANQGWLARVFGRAAADRETVLAELKSANVLDDDRYFLASMSQVRI